MRCGQSLRLCWWIVLLATFVGCSASRIHHANNARNAFAAGNLDVAGEQLQELIDKDKRQATNATLDLAMVQLASGDYRAAEERLRKLRDKFDSMPELAPVREATSMITDDNARVFRAAGYEQVMIRTMLALCSLAGDGQDAESYSLQASMKQAQLQRDAEDRGVADSKDFFQPIAIAPYLRGVLREANHRDYDDAARAYKLVSAVVPTFAPAKADIQRATTGIHSSPGHGVVYVIACVGRGPVLTETVAETTTTALQIASTALRAENADEDEKPTLPNVASVKVPAVLVPPSRVAAVDVSIDGRLFGTTQILTDVSDLAAKQVAAEMPWTIARAVVRRAAKETAVYKASDAIGLQGTGKSLFQFAASSFWSGSEDADTRCWSLLPREIQVLRAELPQGQHDIQIAGVGSAGEVFSRQQRTLNVRDGQNHYLIAIAPDEALYLVGN